MQRLEPRAHIGYLVGYDSTNIYRIWIPSRNKVVRIRDVTFKDNLFYDPSQPDLGHILREEVEQIIEILVLPPQTTQLDYIEELEESDEELTETTDSAQPDVESGPETTTQLETPDPTPERLLEQSTEHQIASTTEISPEQETQTTTTDNQPSRRTNIAPRASEIDPEFQPNYILPEGSSRRAAHAVALAQTTELSAFHGAFTAALSRDANPSWRRYHRDSLPLEPRTWRQMLKHTFSTEFKQAARKELQDLERKETFRYC